MCGGVGDYTRLVARGLAAAGDTVHVFAPGSLFADTGVSTHGLPDHYGVRSLMYLDRILRRLRPDRILVQYTPHAFGYKAMNLPLAVWLNRRAARIAPLWVMFHEVAFPFSWRPLKYAVLAGVNRLMARLIAAAAARLFVSIPAWGELVRRLCPGSPPAEWLPIPSTLPTTADPSAVAAVRRRYAPDGTVLVGHFGTYGPLIAPLLEGVIRTVAARQPAARFLLLGRGACAFRDRLVKADPTLHERLAALAGQLTSEVAAGLNACDLLVQPYPDGVSSRRTTVMAGLANGRPVVTNLGPLSEPVWTEGAVAAAARPDPTALADLLTHLLNDPAARTELAARAAALYQTRFRLDHTLTRLRDRSCLGPTGC